MSKPIVVFDMDDILWGLNQRASKITGVPYEKIITFSSKENPILTDAEKARLSVCYSSIELFRDIEFYSGVDRLNSLDANVYIVSNVFKEEIAILKRLQLHKILNIPKENILLNLVTDEKKKTIPADTYIFIDDSPHNVVDAGVEYNLMIKCPWNTSEHGKELLKGISHEYFDDLDSVIDRVMQLLKEKEN